MSNKKISCVILLFYAIILFACNNNNNDINDENSIDSAISSLENDINTEVIVSEENTIGADPIIVSDTNFVEPVPETVPISEPTDTEPTDTEPTDTEPIGTEPIGTEPIGTEPTDTEPIVTEPVTGNTTAIPVGSNFQEIQFRTQTFYSYSVDLTKNNLCFNSNNDAGNKIQTINNLKQYYSKRNKNVLFATNGGIYNKDFSPTGLYVENEKEISPINLKQGNGNFYLQPNGIFYINKWNKVGIIDSKKYKNIKGKIKYATQSGPLLLLNGEINKHFNENSSNKFVRSGVGIIDNETVVFIISKKPVNFYDFAMLFKENFNCKNALYLDGFISEMYLPEQGLTNSKNNFSVLISIVEDKK